eukprot:1150633-Pelagomonas_calceolata.AAC.7
MIGGKQVRMCGVVMNETIVQGDPPKPANSGATGESLAQNCINAWCLVLKQRIPRIGCLAMACLGRDAMDGLAQRFAGWHSRYQSEFLKGQVALIITLRA